MERVAEAVLPTSPSYLDRIDHFKRNRPLSLFEDLCIFSNVLNARLILEYTQRVFSQASPEAILYDASAAEKTHEATSTTRGIIVKLRPFVEAIQQYGTAIDVYSNIHPLVMGPLWGSVRVVLHVCMKACRNQSGRNLTK